MIGIIRKFFAFAGTWQGRLKKGILFALLNAVAHALQIMALYIVLRDILAGKVTPSTAWSAFGIMLVSMLGCILTKQNATMAEAEGSFYLCAERRTQIGDRMKYMPMGYFNNNSLGQITATVTGTMEDLQDIAPRVMDKTLHGFIHAGITTLFLLFFDWRIGLIVIAGIALFILVNAAMQARSRRITPARIKSQAGLVGAVLEYVQGMSVVRSFNLAAQANQTMSRAIEECEKQNLSLEIAFIPFMFLQSLLLKWVSVLLMGVSILFYFTGTMELSVCLMMLVFSFVLFSQLETAGSMSALLRSIDLSIDRVQEIFQTPLMDEKGKDILPKNHTIEGRHVTFSYGAKKILEDVSFTIPEGTTTAIVGPSGGGKTTLTHLIARFWDVSGGEITLGGINVQEYSLDSLLKNFSMVFQDVYLFNDTILSNIRFGNPAATLEEVRAAAKKACCDDFIMALSNGYDTMVGEGGATLSGGEKQRISIARAILKDAPVIILDEATANVDPENEDRLQAAIRELTREKTVIMIAHRLKTVRHAHQILVIEDGHLAQRGTHDQLLAEDGVYRRFIALREKAEGWSLA